MNTNPFIRLTRANRRLLLSVALNGTFSYLNALAFLWCQGGWFYFIWFVISFSIAAFTSAMWCENRMWLRENRAMFRETRRHRLHLLTHGFKVPRMKLRRDLLK